MDYIFEFATRNKLRFPYKGLVSVEDLWDLNRTQLDGIYRLLMKERKDKEVDSLIISQPANETLELDVKLDIVRYIFDVKGEEARAHEDAARRAEQKQKILDILAKKQDDSLNKMSEEDLLKMLENL